MYSVSIELYECSTSLNVYIVFFRGALNIIDIFVHLERSKQRNEKRCDSHGLKANYNENFTMYEQKKKYYYVKKSSWTLETFHKNVTPA